MLDVGELGLAESHYFLQKMLDMTVNQCCSATQKDAKVRELENRINTITTQSTLHQQLLQHMIEQQGGHFSVVASIAYRIDDIALMR